MRELTTTEIQAVGGAGAFSDATTWLGSQAGDFIGSAIGSLVTIPVLSTVVSKTTGFIGKQIGGWIGGTLGSMFENVFCSNDSAPA